MFPQLSDADHARSVITFAQIDTFLSLVREGSVARAAESLALGRSTVSAHSKLIADEIGHHHFRRSSGSGVVLTEAGLETYNRFRGLLAHAAFCINFFRSGSEAPPAFVSVLMPAGFPGSLLDRAVDQVARRLATWRPDICLLPTYVKNLPADGDLGFFYGSGGTAAEDRWLLIRAGRRACSTHRSVGLDDLAGTRIHAPRLPAALQANLSALAEQANATLQWSDDDVPTIMALVAQSPQATMVIPTSLFNPSLMDDQFDSVLLQSTSLDPALAIVGKKHPAVARLLYDEMQSSLGRRSGVSANPALPSTRAVPLSLKYCRSFLTLYEEGNVGRAAQRLSIVQPALTVQLHRIESQVGCSLFSRSHHGLRANERGHAFYRLLRPLIASFNTTLRHLRTSAGTRSAPIRVGLIPALDDESLMSQGFAIALDNWSRKHPDNVLRVMEGYSGTLVRWLQSGVIDFALVDRSFTDPELTLEAIVEDKMVVVVANDSYLLAPGSVSLERAAQLPLVLPSSRHGLRILLTHSLSRTGLTLQPRIEVDSMAGCLNLVKIGHYATILPMGSVYKSSRRRGLAIHEIKDPQILRTICLAQVRNRPCREAETAFLDELRRAFSGPAHHPIRTLTAPITAFTEVPLAS